jgi:stage V sporulation protein B
MVPKRLALYPGAGNPLASFGVVCGMVFPVLMFPAAILFSLAELLIPELARCHAAGSKRRIPYLARRSLYVALLYGCFFGGLMFLLAEPLCLTLYKSREAGYYLRLYALLIPMLYTDAITDAMTKGMGQQKANVRYNIFTSLLDVVFLFLLLPRYGIGGYFFSFLITHLINFLLSLRRLLKITRLKLNYKKAFLSILCAMGATVLSSLYPGNILPGLLYIPTFFCLLTLLGIVKKADFLWVKSLLIRKKAEQV